MEKKKKSPPKEREWVGSLIGWLVVFVTFFIIRELYLSAAPDGKLVCENLSREISLINFGTCHSE